MLGRTESTSGYSLRRIARNGSGHKVHIAFLKERGIGEINTLLPPIMKLLRIIAWGNEFV